MKLQITEFQSALQRAIIATNEKSMLFLGNIHLKAEDGILSIRSTDLEIGYAEKIEIDKTTGEAIINGKNLSSLINLFSEDINLKFTERGIEVKNSEGKYNFTSQKGELPNLWNNFKNPQKLKVRSDLLRRLISGSMPFVSSNTPYVAMTGISVQIENGEMKFAATNNGFVFSKLWAKSKGKDLNITLPVKTAGLILKAFNGDEELDVSFTENQIEIKDDSISIISSLINSEFPAYEKVLEFADGKKIAIVDRAIFLRSLKRVSFFSDDDKKEIKLSLSKNQIILSVEDLDSAIDGTEKIDVVYEDEEMEILLNSVFLQNCISQIETATVKLKFSDKTKPCMIEPSEQADVKVVMVVNSIRGT